MKLFHFTMKAMALIVLVAFTNQLAAQVEKIQYFRPWDQNGINIFEPSKTTDVEYDGRKVRIGGAFTQQFQALSHENNADVRLDADGKTNLNELYALGNGFNLATANLNLDVQLEDGIRLSVENYMSSRHHSEFWVKGGYVQVDKLPMFNNTSWFDDYFRVKLGHFQINYGDQQFRRTDNGNAIYNPFVGNYVMDAFATEIGGEVYVFPVKNVMGMVGITNGLINGNVQDRTRKPSVYAKLAYDNQITEDFRFRLSGSVYMNDESGRNTLYGGDRAGSRFYEVMENTVSQSDFSGRINPGFSTNVTAFQINPFLKFKGLEIFATYEQSQGFASNDPRGEGASEPEKREVTQVSVEGIYRFLPREQVYIGARYNTVSGALQARTFDSSGQTADLTVNRYEIAAGWFATRNLLLKGSYINQEYKDFPSSNIFAEGQFNGFMIEAVLGF